MVIYIIALIVIVIVRNLRNISFIRAVLIFSLLNSLGLGYFLVVILDDVNLSIFSLEGNFGTMCGILT